MKVFLSVDLEGISGITSLRQISSTGPEYGHARGLMIEDVNAAVAGALEGGATEVLVRDAHGPATNILPDRLHPGARLMAGWMPALDMLQGLDSTFAVAFFIGYHPGPPAAGGVLSHTYSMDTIREVRINGLSAGESAINALQAATHNVPVGLVTGERGLREEIEPILAQAEFVVTKTGYGYQSALLEPVESCRREIRAAAARCVQKISGGHRYPLYRPEEPLHVEIEFHRAEAAAAARLVPCVELTSTRSVVFGCPSAQEFVTVFQLLCQVLYGLKT